MTVVGATQSFVVADVNTPSDTDWLWLKDESKATDQSVLEVPVVVGDQELDYSLMVAPGMTTVNVEVYMSQDVNGTYVAIPEPYKIPVKIADVNFASAEVPTDAFSAGYAYTLNITVYGPQEIKIDAVLTDWKDGGSHEFDPDEDYRPGAGSIPSTPVTTEAPVVLGTDVTEVAYNAFYDGSNAPSYADAVASGTLPWVGFKFDERATDAVFYVKCTYDGTPVTFAERSWYTKVDANTVKVPVPAGCTVVSFEAVAEMGLPADLDASKVVFTVTE